MRNGRSLEGKLVMALVCSFALVVAVYAAATVYGAFTAAADRIAEVTQPVD